MAESLFTPAAAGVFRQAQEQALRLGHSYVGSEHLLLALSQGSGDPACAALNRAGATPQALRTAIAAQVGTGAPGPALHQGLTPACCRIIRSAAQSCSRTGTKCVSPEHLLLGILEEATCQAIHVLKRCGVNRRELYTALQASLGGEEASPRFRPREPETRNYSDTRQLDLCSRDLTKLAAEGRLDPLIGREKELERVIQILSRRSKHNPVLIGEPGVGKTAVAEGLALAIAEGTVPAHLSGRRVCALDLAAMVAGTKYRGEFEDKLRHVLSEVRRAGNVILFVDELHTIIGAGSAEGAIDAANILKPALARGEIQVIGATTIDEYRRHIEKDAALERRFQPVTLSPATREQSLEILKGLRGRYESHHGLVITDEALEAAVDLSIRYLPTRFLPDKAIDLMDEAAARARLSGRTLPPEIRALEQRCLQAARHLAQAIRERNFEQAAACRDAEGSFRTQYQQQREAWLSAQGPIQVEPSHIRAVLEQWSGVPVEDPAEADRTALLNLENSLRAQVLGQDKALEAVSRAIRRSRLGLGDGRRPVGCFLFLGPTGVGKTQLCRSLARTLFGEESALLRFDMSEYMEAHSVSRLLGSPPGYVGHEEGGQLTEAVRRHPWSVVLLDEIEKAHRDIWSVLLQVMEEGTLTDAQGRKTDFRSTVLVMTSNLGARRFSQGTSLGFAGGDGRRDLEREVLKDARQSFSPEFFNRLDGALVFHPLSTDTLLAILEQLLTQSAQRFAKLGITLTWTREAARQLTALGDAKTYGARPLRRLLAQYVEDPAAAMLLEGALTSGQSICLETAEEQPLLRILP